MILVITPVCLEDRRPVVFKPRVLKGTIRESAKGGEEVRAEIFPLFDARSPIIRVKIGVRRKEKLPLR